MLGRRREVRLKDARCSTSIGERKRLSDGLEKNEREGEAAAKTGLVFDIRPLVAIWGEESIGRRSWKSGKPMPAWGNRSFEALGRGAKLERASWLQMGVIAGSGLCEVEIIVVHSQIDSIASEGQRLSCG